MTFLEPGTAFDINGCLLKFGSSNFELVPEMLEAGFRRMRPNPSRQGAHLQSWFRGKSHHLLENVPSVRTVPMVPGGIFNHFVTMAGPPSGRCARGLPSFFQ
ncbi:MAG: hypothetical protein H0U98_14640 [Alphaproteobacteria bacterium]|nr:hypothetical protein [Alphaproteobacteria bacterium]